MSIRLGALVLVMVAVVAPLHSQTSVAKPPSPDPVDALVAKEMERLHVPGVSLAILRRGQVIKVAGYGKADLEHDLPVTPETVFKIGSVSKQFLATGIMLLLQDGRLTLDDPIGKYLTDAPASWKGITIRHFLTHTSGVLREGPAFDPFKVQADSIVIASAYSQPLVFPTGSKYQYCNVCYFALAEIITRASGKPWDAFLTERVFRPVGMTATRTTTTTALVPRRARGYVWRNSVYENADELIALRPSGAFLSTVSDLARWDAALYDDRVLTQSSRNQMWTPMRLNDGNPTQYGFGWQLDALDGHRGIHHGGSLPGFRAQMSRFPDDDLTVIVLTNGDSAQPATIASGVARQYLSRK
jgi:CubicO group peptidase (beta-lactamase class C family)